MILEKYRVHGLGIDTQATTGPHGRDKIRRVLREAGVSRMRPGNQMKHAVPAPGFKTCTGCNLLKPVEQFGKHRCTHDRLRPTCKTCHCERNHWMGLRRKYGITQEAYHLMLADQNGVCFTCGQPESYKNRTRLSVDHNHETGVVRKLLCHRCNIIVGLSRECPDVCGNIKEYLLEHQQIQ